MRLPFLCLLLSLCLQGFSQRSEYFQAFRDQTPPGLGQEIFLPDPGLDAAFDLHRFDPRFGNKLIFVVATDSMYHRVFSNYQKDSLPFIDFSRNELVMYSACGQCLANCEHDKQENTACHRNACYYMRAWFIRARQATDMVKAGSDQ